MVPVHSFLKRLGEILKAIDGLKDHPAVKETGLCLKRVTAADAPLARALHALARSGVLVDDHASRRR